MSATNQKSDGMPLEWSEICSLAASGRFDGFHVDTDEWGRILMTPVNLNHGLLAAEIVFLLRQHLSAGRAAVEVGVSTRKGVKAPDVMWMSDERLKSRTGEYEDPVAGEICIEVLSASNHPTEIEQKRALYFEQGAHEVWICDSDGLMKFWVDDVTCQQQSRFAPRFPQQISAR